MKIKLWDAKTGALRATLDAGTQVGPLAFSPDGKLLASALGRDSALRLWEVVR
jgi:WD40 repeat protein